MTSLYSSAGALSQLSVPVAKPVFAGNVLAVHSIVIFTGQVMTGGVLSSTVMDCRHVELLPQSSVAVHNLEIVYSCGQVIEAIVMSLNINERPESQLSVAVVNPV